MDARILEVLERKAREAKSRAGQAGRLADALAGGNEQFASGVILGGMYNSFHYQSRRILGRDPTEAEFEEFLEFVRGSSR